jgi:hypothetical protein
MLPARLTRIRPTLWSLALVAVLLLALSLRFWGIRHGLPIVYNPDEQSHFVPKAVAFFQSGYNPDYYSNPPGLSYLLHLVFAVWFGGESGVLDAWSSRPSDVYLVARYTSAILGTLAVLLTYLTGRRLFDAKHGVFAAALLAVAFLPVFYGHQAVNDGAQLAPIALSLFGSAGILTRGRLIDYVVAGTGLGLACGTKYTAGIMLIPLLAAAVSHVGEPTGRRRVAVGLCLAGLSAAAAFALTVPGIVFDTSAVLEDMRQLSPEGEPKLGQGEESGIRYYVWTLTWGLGWVASLAALVGAVALARSDRRIALVLVPAPVVFILVMGIQDRYFGRYLLPIFPLACLLASYGIIRLSHGLSRRAPRLAPAFTAVAALALLFEGLAHSVHVDLVLSKTDTRMLAQEWMVANIPPGALIVREPNTVRPRAAAESRPARGDSSPAPKRWLEFSLGRSIRRLVRTQQLPLAELPGEQLPPGRISSEDAVAYLQPELIDEYIRVGACWVVVGNSQWGRAFAEPETVPGAVDYYRALARRGRAAYSVLPYDRPQDPREFNFDWSSNYYPRNFDRPGPEIIVYRLDEGRCGSSAGVSLTSPSRPSSASRRNAPTTSR